MKYLFIFILLIATFCVNAQEVDFLSGQRPGYSENASPLVTKTIQIETGYDYVANYNIFSTLARYAPFKRFEVRVVTAWQKNTTAFGVKYVILNKPNIPTLAILIDITDDFNYNHCRLSSSYNFTDNLSILVNYGRYEHFGFGTINLGYSINQHVFTYIESYIESDLSQYNCGLGYYINSDIALDASIGYISTNDLYFGIGGSFRFRHK